MVVRKGGGEGLLLIPQTVVDAVEAYLATRTDDSPWLWAGFTRQGRTGDRLTEEGVRHIVAKLAAKVGIPHFSPHQLRHTSATSLLDAGVQESIIANHLGHHGLGTLSTYAEVRPKRRKEALDALEVALGGQAARTAIPATSPTGADRFYTAAYLGPLLARMGLAIEELEERVHHLEERARVAAELEKMWGEPFTIVDPLVPAS